MDGVAVIVGKSGIYGSGKTFVDRWKSVKLLLMFVMPKIVVLLVAVEDGGIGLVVSGTSICEIEPSAVGGKGEYVSRGPDPGYSGANSKAQGTIGGQGFSGKFTIVTGDIVQLP